MPDKRKLAELQPGESVQGKHLFEVVRLLGAGSFGAVYQVKELSSGEEFAMKTESKHSNSHILKMERCVMEELGRTGSNHACKIYDKGRAADKTWVFVVMTLLGDSLSEIRRKVRKMSLGTAVRTGRQGLWGLRDLHSVGYLHRDVKPGNFAVGRPGTPEHRILFILDFGLCRRFRNEKGELKTPRQEAGFRGTVRYAPINCHRSVDLGRKDDLESWCYVLIELTAQHLPWWRETERDVIADWKTKCRADGSLYKHCPERYKPILDYIDRLEMWDEPDYDYIDKVLTRVLTDNNIHPEEPYDWEIPDSNNNLGSTGCSNASTPAEPKKKRTDPFTPAKPQTQ